MSGARSTRTACDGLNPSRVSTASPCLGCSKAARDTSITISNGLKIIRARYGLPYDELPNLEVASLGRYLQFLLMQGKERASVLFPRRQGRPDVEGLTPLIRLGRKERWELAHSVNSIKRNLPAGCLSCRTSRQDEWRRLAFSLPPPSDPEYISFVKKEVTRLFPPCWDRGYTQGVNHFLPNASSREQAFPGGPGLRADHLWKGRREEFIRKCTSEIPLGIMKARFKEVLSAGKVRPLVIFDHEMDLLAPLHKKVYRHLMKQDWLLLGPPTPDRIKSVCVGHYQTSVDLVNATDGLCSDVTHTILDTMFFNAIEIPRTIRDFAHESIRPSVRSPSGAFWGEVVHGQMMGSYLSFPLLCVQSYLAARWAARFDECARFLVNGDDCIISASRPVLTEDYPKSFRLNSEKTIRAENTVEINSTVFLRTGGAWREVKHLRRGGFLPTFSGMLHAASAVRHSVPWTDAFIRARIGRRWGMLPSQLGLTPRSRVAWRREHKMRAKRGYTALPSQEDVRCHDLLMKVDGVPDPDEKEALLDFFWQHGRDGGCKRDTYEPSIGQVRRTYSYRRIPRWSALTFVGQLRTPPTAVGSGDKYLVPAEYESQREQGRMLALEVFRRHACPT